MQIHAQAHTHNALPPLSHRLSLTSQTCLKRQTDSSEHSKQPLGSLSISSTRWVHETETGHHRIDLLVTSDTVAGPTTEILSKTRDSQRHPSLGYVTAHRTEEEARVRGQWAHLEASWDSNVQPPHTHTHTLVPLPHVPVAAQSWQKQQGGSGNKTCMPHSTFSVTSDPQAFPSSFWLHLHPTPFFAVHHCLGWSTYSQSSCSACSSSAGGQGGRSGLKAPTGFLWLQHGGTPGLLKELGWATTGVSKNMLLEWVFS